MHFSIDYSRRIPYIATVNQNNPRPMLSTTDTARLARIHAQIEALKEFEFPAAAVRDALESATNCDYDVTVYIFVDGTVEVESDRYPAYRGTVSYHRVGNVGGLDSEEISHIVDALLEESPTWVETHIRELMLEAAYIENEAERLHHLQNG